MKEKKISLTTELFMRPVIYLLMLIFNFAMSMLNLPKSAYLFITIGFITIWLALIYISTNNCLEEPDEMTKEITVRIDHTCLATAMTLLFLLSVIGSNSQWTISVNNISLLLLGALVLSSAQQAILFYHYNKNGLPTKKYHNL